MWVVDPLPGRSAFLGRQTKDLGTMSLVGKPAVDILDYAAISDLTKPQI